eukprot:707184-Pleurochrysis_carterae.AAC.1
MPVHPDFRSPSFALLPPPCLLSLSVTHSLHYLHHPSTSSFPLSPFFLASRPNPSLLISLNLLRSPIPAPSIACALVAPVPLSLPLPCRSRSLVVVARAPSSLALPRRSRSL